MKKIIYSIMALMGMMLATACSDNDIVENIVPENPQENTQKIYLNATIPAAQTRVTYSEVKGGMKMQWNKDDYLMVFPGKKSRDEIKLSTHDYPDYDNMTDTEKTADEHFTYDSTNKRWVFTSDKAYLFKIVKGETEVTGSFVYDGHVVYYEETESEKDYVVSSKDAEKEKTVTIRVKNHNLVEDKTPSGVGMATLDISTISGIALWEHPDNESGDCQIANNSTAHLKYQEVLVGNVEPANFKTEGSSTTTKDLELKHPKKVIFKIIMNQFLYDIHRGAHVAIRALKPGTGDLSGTFEDDGLIDGVYHQAREEFFAYEQEIEPIKMLEVSPANNALGYAEETVGSKVFAGDRTHKLTTYIMVDASKLDGKRYFQFSLKSATIIQYTIKGRFMSR